MRKIRMSGYFTVEAAMVLPMVIGTIIFIIYMQLYWYDRCLMDQETAMLAIQAVNLKLENMEEIDEELTVWKEKNLTDKFVAWRQGEVVLTKQYDKIKLSRSGSLLTDHALWNANAQYENRLIKPASFLRLCRKLSMTEGEKEG